VITSRPAAQAVQGRTGPSRRSTILAMAFVTAVLVYLYAPVVVTVLFSFTTSPRLSLPIEGLTLEWYQKAFSYPLFTDALRNTFLLAVMTAVVAGGVGTLFSFGMVKVRHSFRGPLLTASLLPAAVPALVIGIAMAVFFSAAGQQQGLVNTAIGHTVIALPFVVLTMNARLETFDFSTLEAARDLGASPWRTFRDITFPLIRPSVLGAALLAMSLSLDEFVVTWFNIGNQQTLPVLIWGLLRRGIDPSINALAAVVLVSLIGLIVLSYLVNRRSR
jgi:spermidine/putrescine transport system permease protein